MNTITVLKRSLKVFENLHIMVDLQSGLREAVKREEALASLKACSREVDKINNHLDATIADCARQQEAQTVEPVGCLSVTQHKEGLSYEVNLSNGMFNVRQCGEHPLFTHPAPPPGGDLIPSNSTELESKRDALISESPEINQFNYTDEEVVALNEWCIRAYALLSGDMLAADAQWEMLQAAGDMQHKALVEKFGEPAQKVAVPQGSGMTAEKAAYFMRRFKTEEKLLGPNEQAAIDYVLAMLATTPQPAPTARVPRIYKGILPAAPHPPQAGVNLLWLATHPDKLEPPQAERVPMDIRDIYAVARKFTVIYNSVPAVEIELFIQAIEKHHSIGVKP